MRPFTEGLAVALTDIDRKLLQSCLAREPGAWNDFVDRFLGLFIHVIRHTAQSRSVTLGNDDVDDLCSEVFLALVGDDFAILRRFEGRSSLATYLTVISRRIVVREIARRRFAEAFGHVPAHQSALEQAHATKTPEFERIENRDLVQRMLSELPPVDAEIVRLYHLENKSYREIGRELGVNENSIGPTLYRARQKLGKAATVS